jgi:hypothetical protein
LGVDTTITYTSSVTTTIGTSTSTLSDPAYNNASSATITITNNNSIEVNSNVDVYCTRSSTDYVIYNGTSYGDGNSFTFTISAGATKTLTCYFASTTDEIYIEVYFSKTGYTNSSTKTIYFLV